MTQHQRVGIHYTPEWYRGVRLRARRAHQRCAWPRHSGAANVALPSRRGDRMKRRQFIIGSITLWMSTPSFAQNTNTAKRRRIVIAHSSSPVSEIRIDGDNPFVNALFDELVKLGWVEGKTLEIVRFSANGRTDHFKQIAGEIVKSSPEIIVANTSAFVRSLKDTTASIPIVGVTADPLAYGLTKSLSRPDGNVTGVSVDAGLELWGKRLSIVREILPSAS